MIATERKLTWREADSPEYYTRLEQVVGKWEGTPYQAGQRSCQQGVDCVRFVEGVLEELYRFEDDFHVDRIPQDASCHDGRAVRKVMEQMLRRYPHELNISNEVQPGDVIIVNQGKFEGHTGIVGPKINQVFHALPGVGVCMSGIGYLNDQPIAHTIHMREKHTWV